MLNIGILGCGTIARVRHAPEYETNAECRIVAFADAVPSRAAELAEKYGAEVCKSCEELLARNDIDAVSICTANATHAELSCEAMRRGKHVLCEKPMALTVDEAERICATARETRRIFVPAHNQRLFASHIKGKQMLASGRLGRVISFDASFQHAGPESWSIDSSAGCWFFGKKAGCGVLSDLAVHKIDAVNDLLGDPIDGIASDLCTLDKKNADGSPIEVCDRAVLLCRTRGGVRGVITVSWSNYGCEQNSISLYCEKGRLLLNPMPGEDLTVETREGREVFALGGIATNNAQTSSGVIDAFVDAVLGRREPFARAEDGCYSIAAMAAAEDAEVRYRPVLTE